VRSRTSTIRMTSPSHFCPPITTLSWSAPSSFGRRVPESGKMAANPTRNEPPRRGQRLCEGIFALKDHVFQFSLCSRWRAASPDYGP